MLTTLQTLKIRLAIAQYDAADDTLLTNFILLVSARFENDCNRKFGYAQNVVDEFQADERELRVSRYPIDESQPIAFMRLAKASEGWQSLSNPEYVVRRGCVISLVSALGGWQEQIRVTYSGGYLLPDQSPDSNVQAPALPDDLGQSCVEQCAYLYQNKERLGLVSVAAEGGRVQHFAKLDLLPSVASVLEKYERWMP